MESIKDIPGLIDFIVKRNDIRWTIISIFFLLLVFVVPKIKEVYDFYDNLSRRKLTVLKGLAEERGATGRTREVVQEKINAESFRRATGINAEKHLREKIINLHEQAGGRLTYVDFRRARPFLRIRRDGTLKVRKFTWLDRVQHYFYSLVSGLSLFAGIFLLVLLLFVPNIEPRLELAMLLYVLFFLIAALFFQSVTFPLPAARKIKDEICKRYLSDAEKEEARRRFESHFGEIDLGHPAGTDNEGIDADLAREYASDH